MKDKHTKPTQQFEGKSHFNKDWNIYVAIYYLPHFHRENC